MPEIATLEELSETPHAEVFDEDRPRTVRLELEAGEQIPSHRHPGMDVVLHVVSGHLEVALDGEPHGVTAGQLVQFSGDREVSPEATEPTTAVVVFAPRPD